MAMTPNAVIIVSGLWNATLARDLCKLVGADAITEWSMQTIRYPSPTPEGEHCVVDLLRIRCPASLELLEKMVDWLKGAVVKVLPSAVPDIRLRIGQSHSLTLLTDSLAAELLLLHEQENSRVSRLGPMEELELDVLTHCGKRGREAFVSRVDRGNPELAIGMVDQIIEEQSHSVREHPVDFAF